MTFTDYDGTACSLDDVSECVTAQIEAADSGDPSPVMDDAVSTARFLLQAIKRIRELEGAVELLRKCGMGDAPLSTWWTGHYGDCLFCDDVRCGRDDGRDCADRNLAMKLTSEVR